MTSEPAARRCHLDDEFPLRLPRWSVLAGLVIMAVSAMVVLLVRLQAATAIQASIIGFFVLLLGGWGLGRLIKGASTGLMPILRLMPDGSAVIFDRTRPDSAKSVHMKFVWRGPRYVRLVIANSAGGATDWRLYKSDLNAPQWRALCRWTVWLERGQTSS